MSAERAVCLRCDWSGEALEAERPCPACGVALYVLCPDREPSTPSPRPAAASGPNLPSAGRRSAETASTLDEAGRPGDNPDLGVLEPGTSSEGARRFAPLAIAGLLIVAVLVGRSILDTDRATRGPIVSGRGTLVYAAEAGDGTEGIWAVDLATGSIVRGAEIDGISELFRIDDGRSSTSIALTRIAVDGRSQALAIAGYGVIGARPDLLVVGDKVAWGPRGLSVSAASTVGDDESCAPAVRARAYDLARFQEIAVTEPGEACGQLLSTGRDEHRTYLSVADGERVRTTWVTAAGSPHRIGGHRALTGVSPTGDLLLTPVRFVSLGIVPVRTRFPEPIPQAISGTVLAWPGRGGPVPLMSGGERLLVQKVLAWSPDGARAIVLGSAGERVGIFTFTTGAGTGQREARLLSPPRGPVGGATFLDDGTAVIAAAGRLFRLEPSGLHEVALPASAPLPQGPIAWMPPVPTS
ncbi:MAG: hypothetical protein WEA10_00705 [Actinomycetota bacterium]